MEEEEYEVYYYPETGQSLAVRKYYIGQRLRVIDSFSQVGVAGVKFEIKNAKGLKLKYTTDAWGYTPYIYLNADDTFFYQMQKSGYYDGQSYLFGNGVFRLQRRAF